MGGQPVVIFLRVVIIGSIIIAIFAYTAGYAASDAVIRKIRPALTREIVSIYNTGLTGADLQYKYNAVIRFNPPRIEVYDLYIRSHAMKVDDSVFYQTHLQIDRIDVELLPLYRDDELVVTAIDGIRFLGFIPYDELQDRYDEKNPNLSETAISYYNGRVRLRGRFSTVGQREHTIVGDYGINDEGAVDIIHRSHYGPYGGVSGSVANQMDTEYDFSIQLPFLGKETQGQNTLWVMDEGPWLDREGDLHWTKTGLWLVVSDHHLVVEIPDE
jgi:hypothetical protein